MEILGFIFALLLMVYFSAIIVFLSIDTLSQGLFSREWYDKLIGCVLWVVMIYSWMELFSHVSISG